MFLVIIVSLGREFFMCTNVVASGWCFQYSYLYTVMITIFFGGGGAGGSFYPLNTLPSVYTNGLDDAWTGYDAG